MKKRLFFIIFVIVFSCKEKDKKYVSQEKENQKKEISKLPFGNQQIKSFNFSNDGWVDDYNNEDLQLATKDIYEEDLDTLKKINLKVEIPPINQKYFLLKGESIETFEITNPHHTLYFLHEENSYKLYYTLSKSIDAKNEIFEKQTIAYLITLDNENNIIDNITFNYKAYSSVEYSDRWSFLNTRISYINDSKEIFVYDFKCKEWDLNYEFKLMEVNKYIISSKGKFIAL